jgi:hypothetical protein|tara:strand:+ start:169 stop:513 length:345 start_codon:yes stop_codon:yes gene_type:complete
MCLLVVAIASTQSTRQYKIKEKEMMLTEIEQKINLIEDVRELKQIQQFVKDRKRTLGNRLKYELTVGDNVLVHASNGIEEGTVTKVNRTRAVVDMRGGSWTVPFEMITKEVSDE